MIEIDTVDGSELWLTSSYGSHTSFSAGFQHHLRWCRRLFQGEMQAYIEHQIRKAHPQLYLLKPCKDLTVIFPKTKVASWKIPLFNRKCTSSASHVGGNRPPAAISESKLLITNIHLALQQPQSLFWMASKNPLPPCHRYMLLNGILVFPLRVFVQPHIQ